MKIKVNNYFVMNNNSNSKVNNNKIKINIIPKNNKIKIQT